MATCTRMPKLHFKLDKRSAVEGDLSHQVHEYKVKILHLEGYTGKKNLYSTRIKQGTLLLTEPPL